MNSGIATVDCVELTSSAWFLISSKQLNGAYIDNKQDVRASTYSVPHAPMRMCKSQQHVNLSWHNRLCKLYVNYSDFL